MCTVFALASLAVSAATTAADYSAQSAMASAQKQQNAANTQNIDANLRSQYQQAGQQMYYRDVQAEQKAEQNQNQTRSAMATAAASGGENGVQGATMSELANEYMGNSANYRADVNFNRTAQDEEIMGQMGGFNSEAQSRLNSLPVPNKPNPFASALQIGGAGLNAYDLYKRGTDPNWMKPSPGGG